MIYVGLIILVLFLSPIFVDLYIRYVPGIMIGSIDGWLGFLGGYSGGLLAFFAAYQIFNRQRKDNVKPFLILDNEVPKEELGKLIFSNKTGGPIDLCETDLKIQICIKNIGLASALNINIFDYDSKKKVIFFANKLNSIVDIPYLGCIEKSKKKFWILMFPQRMFDGGNISTKRLILSYQDIYGNKHRQKIFITLDQDRQHYFSEIRT